MRWLNFVIVFKSNVPKKDEALDLNSLVTSCHIVIEKPDIILVESLDDIDTNAVMLNVSCLFYDTCSSSSSKTDPRYVYYSPLSSRTK